MDRRAPRAESPDMRSQTSRLPRKSRQRPTIRQAPQHSSVAANPEDRNKVCISHEIRLRQRREAHPIQGRPPSEVPVSRAANSSDGSRAGGPVCRLTLPHAITAMGPETIAERSAAPLRLSSALTQPARAAAWFLRAGTRSSAPAGLGRWSCRWRDLRPWSAIGPGQTVRSRARGCAPSPDGFRQGPGGPRHPAGPRCLFRRLIRVTAAKEITRRPRPFPRARTLRGPHLLAVLAAGPVDQPEMGVIR